MAQRLRRVFALLCLLGLTPAAIFFGIFHPERAGKGKDLSDSNKVPSLQTRETYVGNVNSVPRSKSAILYNSIERNSYGAEDVLKQETCFQEGTARRTNKLPCICKKGWNAVDCSIPDAIWSSDAFKFWHSLGLIRRRRRPRNVINGMIFNHELDLLEVRVKELGDAVDHFIVVESMYTNFGERKPLHLKSNLSVGFLREHVHKIVPIAVDFYNYDDGDPWGPENYLRTTIWYEGQRRLRNIRDDDLFIMSDADEIPSRDVILFLKHHDGYGEPILFRLRWFMYGFFWEKTEPVNVTSVCTVAFMQKMCGNDSLRLRSIDPYMYGWFWDGYENDSMRLRSLDTYTHRGVSRAGTFNVMWTIEGTSPRYAGWHCSWCFDAQGIQVKLASAQRDDGVRWGDIAEKTDIAYINSLRKRGQYFDDSSSLRRCDAHDAAPAFVRRNPQRFRYLMTP